MWKCAQTLFHSALHNQMFALSGWLIGLSCHSCVLQTISASFFRARPPRNIPKKSADRTRSAPVSFLRPVIPNDIFLFSLSGLQAKKKRGRSDKLSAGYLALIHEAKNVRSFSLGLLLAVCTLVQLQLLFLS